MKMKKKKKRPGSQVERVWVGLEEVAMGLKAQTDEEGGKEVIDVLRNVSAKTLKPVETRAHLAPRSSTPCDVHEMGIARG